MKEEKTTEATGGTEAAQTDAKAQLQKILEGNKKLANVEIQEILQKYDCSLTATMTITPTGNYPQVVIVNNQAN